MSAVSELMSVLEGVAGETRPPKANIQEASVVVSVGAISYVCVFMSVCIGDLPQVNRGW